MIQRPSNGREVKCHPRAERRAAIWVEKGEVMSTAVLTMDAFTLEYQSHRTIAATDNARLKVAKAQQQSLPRVARVIAECLLWLPFRSVVHQTQKLVGLLEKMEALPSSVLLENEMVTIPQSLHELFRKMCAVIQQTETVGLHDGFVLKTQVARLKELGQQVNGFADRYEDAQTKLRSRVAAEEVSHYQESFAAYGNCGPTPEQPIDDEDVKGELLHF
jgi:hypothetical protein